MIVKLLERIKTGLEKPEKGAATVTLRLTDLAVLTWAVPADRIASLLPEGLTADRLPGPDGELMAFVQTTCAFCEDARWSPAPIGTGSAYRSVTYRILARHEKDRPGVFVVRAFYSNDTVRLAGRAMHRDADFARFSVHVAGDPVRGTFDGYQLRVLSDHGTTEWSIGAVEDRETPPPPFGRWDDMHRFLLRREANYFVPSAGPRGYIGYAPMAFPEELPKPGIAPLVSARLTPWREMGVLTAEEIASPQSVLLLPTLSVTAYPPRLMRIASIA